MYRIVGVCSDLLCLLLRVWSKCAISLPDDSAPDQRGGSPIGIDGASWVGMCVFGVCLFECVSSIMPCCSGVFVFLFEVCGTTIESNRIGTVVLGSSVHSCTPQIQPRHTCTHNSNDTSQLNYLFIQFIVCGLFVLFVLC